MKKRSYLFLYMLLTVIACNDSTDNNNATEVPDTIINQDVVIEETYIESKNKASIKQEIEVSQNNSVLKLADEEIVFSFETEKGKTMNIIVHKEEKYMAYRFGTNNKIELQFPEKLINTFEQFSYNYYFRGGGAANMGLDLNYLSFLGDTHKFIIFQEYSAEGEEGEGESESVGIRIINLKTKKEIEIKGINSTVEGHLIEFRDNGLVKIVDGI